MRGIEVALGAALLDLSPSGGGVAVRGFSSARRTNFLSVA
jgi:hypothetical protein